MADEKRSVDLYINTKGPAASLKELTSDSRKLNAELAKLDPTTKEFADKSKQLQKVNDRLKSLKDDVRGVSQEVSKGSSTMSTFKGAMMAAFSFTAILEAGKAVFNFFSEGVKKNMEFNKSLSDLQAITGVTKEELKFFKQEARALSDETGIAAKDIVEAYKLIGGAKPELLANKEALAAITKEAITLAEASGLELPKAAAALTDALNQFSAPAEQAGKYINALAAGSQAGAAEVPEITDALLKFGVAANSSNISIEESVGLIETLADKGIKGAEAGTALRNVLAKLSAPDTLPKEALAILKEFDVDVKKLSDTTIPFSQRLGELSKIQGDATAITRVFGLENKNAAQVLMENKTRFEELTLAVTGTNTAYDQAHIVTDNLSHDYEELVAVIENSQMSMADSSDSVLRDITQFATEVIRNSEPVGEAFGSIGNVLGRLFDSFGRIINVFLPFNDKAEGASTLMKVLGTVINNILLPLRVFITGVTVLTDGLNILLDTGKQVANFFGADFELDPDATFQKLGENLLDNATEIATSYKDIWTDTNKEIQKENQAFSFKSKEDFKKQVEEDRAARRKEEQDKIDQQKAAQDKDREARKKALDKRLKDEADAAKNLRKLQQDALGDSMNDRIKKLQLQAKNEIADLKGTEEQKAAQRKLIEQRTLDDINKVRKKHGEEESKRIEAQLKAKEAFEKELQARKNLSDLATIDARIIMAGNNEARILELKQQRLEKEREIELQNKELTEGELMLIEEKYRQQREEISAEDRIKKAENTTEDLNRLSQAVDVIGQFNDVLTQRSIQKADEEKNAKIKKLDEELASKKISEEQYQTQRKKIEEESGKQIAASKTKQAIFDKGAKLAQAVISLALARLQAFAQLGPLAAAVLPFINIAGALNIALIAATPIPKFAKGGSTKRGINSYRAQYPTVMHGGFIDQPMIAEFGEEGPEYVVPNWMLGNPMIADMVGIMESIRTPRRGFAVGGPTGPVDLPSPSGSAGQASTQAQNTDAVLDRIDAMISAILGWRTQLTATVSYDSLEEADQEVFEIREESTIQ